MLRKIIISSFLIMLAATSTAPASSTNTPADTAYAEALTANLTHPSEEIQIKAMDECVRLKETRALPLLIDLLSTESPLEARIFDTLKKITDKDLGERWPDWAEGIGRMNIIPLANYSELKRELLLRRDKAFAAFPLTDDTLKPLLTDLFWTGEQKDGVPALTNPPLTPRKKVDFLDGDEVVYGIQEGTQARAYPARIVDWHLIVNDTLARYPICIVVCPYSQTVAAYRTDVDGTPVVFGFSGLVYKNNLLLYDRKHANLWKSFDGKALSGEAAKAGAALTPITVTQTTWREWLDRFPDTEVMNLETGYTRPYQEPSPYFFESMRDHNAFPVASDSNTHEKEAKTDGRQMIYGIIEGNSAKAFLLTDLWEKEVVNAELNGVNLLLYTDRESGSIRAYRRESYTFSFHKRFAVRDENNTEWDVKEDGVYAKKSGEILPRLIGKRAFLSSWLAWYPQSEMTHEP